MPELSAVIAVYCASGDHERFLRDTLESVAAQTYRDFELILVDDQSPVDIAPVVASVEGLPEVRILRNERNLGHAESRNAGIRAARGELIAFLDHDDVWLPEKLERQVEVLRSSPEAAAVFCDVEVFGPNASRLKIDQSIIPDRPGVLWFLNHGNYTITVSAVVVKKQAMLDIGLFDSRYTSADDFDAWLRILMRAPIVHIPEKLARYRLHGTNVNYNVNRLVDNRLLTGLIWRYWRRAPLSERLPVLWRILRKLLGRVYFAFRPYRKS